MVLLMHRHTNLERKLLQTESKWIFCLNTVQPNGLNEYFNLSSFFIMYFFFDFD